MSADGRFAPSPTGPLHLGSLRTALVAWLFARSQDARFLLRVEDLDPQRSRAEFEATQIRDLEAIGIDWDGEVVRQSARMALYEGAIGTLQDAGAVYPCFCSRAEVREAASAPHGALPEGSYPGTCRRLSRSERSRRIDSGRPYALRLDARAERVDYADRLLGARSLRVDDFVVRRADGVPAYQLAVVVDDAAQGIGEVVRGEDLADSTPRQILLARRLGLPVPTYAHVPLVIGPDGARLAKRHGATTLAELSRGESDGGRVLTWLARSLGLALDRERVSCAAELLGEFTPARVPRDPVVAGPAGRPPQRLPG